MVGTKDVGMKDHLVYQRCFAMVDVGNDGYVSYFSHFTNLGAKIVINSGL
jgi:hypothetical protein